MPYDAVVIVEKFVEISNSMCKAGAHTVAKPRVIACNMKSFEKQLVVWPDCLLQVPIIIHLVEAQV